MNMFQNILKKYAVHGVPAVEDPQVWKNTTHSHCFACFIVQTIRSHVEFASCIYTNYMDIC